MAAVTDYLKIIGQSSVFGQGWIRKSPQQIIFYACISLHLFSFLLASGWTTATIVRSSRGIDEDKLRPFLEIYKSDASPTYGEVDSLLCLQSLAWESKPAVYDISPSGKYTLSLYNRYMLKILVYSMLPILDFISK